MRKTRFLMALGCAGVITASLLQFHGCGSDSSGPAPVDSATVSGDVSGVTGPTAMNPTGHRWFAFFNIFGPSQAIAQACTATDVLACLTSGETEVCSAVDGTTCEFSNVVAISEGLTMRFVSDTDQDGVADEGEPSADLTDDLGEACDDLSVTVSGVDIDFDTETATATTVDRDPEECPTPEPTATSQPEATPTPTQEPEPTPTETPGT